LGITIEVEGDLIDIDIGWSIMGPQRDRSLCITWSFDEIKGLPCSSNKQRYHASSPSKMHSGVPGSGNWKG